MEATDPFHATRRAAQDALDRGDRTGATVLLERALADTNASPMWRSLARSTLSDLLHIDGRLTDAVAQAELAVVEASSHPPARCTARRTYANSLWSLCRRSEAEEALKEAFRDADAIDDSLQRLLQKSFVLFAQADYEGCLTLLRACLPYTANAYGEDLQFNRHVVASLCAIRIGRPVEALSFAQSAHRISPGATSCECHAIAYYFHGDLNNAIFWREKQHRESVAKGDPVNEAGALIVLAGVRHLAGRCADGLSLVHRATALEPTSRLLVASKIGICLSLGRNEDALAAWESTPRRQRPLPLPYSREEAGDRAAHRAAIALAMEDYEAALVFGEQAMQTTVPVHRAARRGSLVRALAGLGKFADATAELEAMTSEIAGFADCPSLASEVRCVGAKLAMAESRWEDAIECWKAALRGGVYPISQPSIWVELGDCLRNAGHGEAARLAWSNATKTDVESHWVRKAAERLAEV